VQKQRRAYWTYANGTVEEDVIERVVARLEGIEVIVGVDRHLAKEIESKMFAKIAR
jgi:trehalose utilization protein